jgi:hypothetical protein
MLWQERFPKNGRSLDHACPKWRQENGDGIGEDKAKDLVTLKEMAEAGKIVP